ncbi:MAG: CHAT domain-containing protein [Deltaproteobacteria bacterium]|nr:CHAT domain-containing protein [Deltaproteobacteria bacterium]
MILRPIGAACLIAALLTPWEVHSLGQPLQSSLPGANRDPFEEGRRLHLSGEPGPASQLYRQAIDDPATPTETRAKAHNNLCLILFSGGESTSAVKNCRAALRLRKALGETETPSLARTFNNLGLALHSSGQLQEAERTFHSALEINRRLNLDEGEIINLSNLASVAEELGDYGQALELHRQGEDLAETSEGAPWAQQRLNIARLNQGVLLERLGAFDEALSKYHQAIASGALDPSAEALARLNTGVAYRNLGDSAKAVAAFERAIEVFQTLKEPGNLSNAWLNLGIVRHLNLGDLDAAETAFRQALRLAVQTDEARQRIQSRFYLGRLLLDQERWDEAEEQFEICLKVSTASGSAEGRWSALEGLGLLAASRGDLEAASQQLLQAVGMIEGVHGTLEPGHHRSGFFGDKREVYGAAVEVLAAIASRDPSSTAKNLALEVVQKAKSRELVEVIGSKGAGGDDESPNRASRTAALSSKSLVSAVGERFLLEFFFALDHLFAWRVEEGESRLFDLGPKEPIEKAAQRLHQSLARHTDPKPDDLRFLSQALVTSTELWPEAGGTVFIAPDGALHAIPFEILAGPATATNHGRPLLVDSYAISYLPSGSSLGWSRPPLESLPLTLVGFAFSDPLGDSSRDALGTEFLPLPASSQELRASAQKLPGQNQLHLGSDATEAAFRQAARTGTHILHAATHTILEDRRGVGSAIRLYPDDENDGLLTAAEIADLDFRVDLTVLASCQSANGLGQDSRALTSLTGAALAAGSRAILATLWDVGDRETAAFMEQFYYQLGRGLSPDLALQAAKQQFIQDDTWADPSIWAAYVLIGDAPAIVSRPRHSRWIWPLVGLVGAAGLFLRRRRRSFHEPSAG